MLHKILKEIQESYQISSREIIAKTEIDEKRFSQFRKGSKTLNSEALWKIIVALDRIEPKARRDFGLKIGKIESTESKQERLIELIDTASDKDLEEVLIAVAKRFGDLRRNGSICKEKEDLDHHI